MVESRTFKVVSITTKLVAGAVIFLSLVYAFWTLGRNVETRFAPVVEKLQIVSIRPSHEGLTTIIMARFNKVRPCEYLGMAWFRKLENGEFERVPHVERLQPEDNGNRTRPLGVQRAGPWEIWMSPEDLQNRSFALLYHHCHPFWTTITEFYP